MRNSIVSVLLRSTLLLALPVVFTSCGSELEDLLGVKSNSTGTISYVETTYLKGSKDPVKTFTNALTLTGDGAVSYESSNTAVATVDASGKVTTTGAPGTATITAKVSDSDTYTYATREAAYTLEVKEGYSYREWDDGAQRLVSKVVSSSDCNEITSNTSPWSFSEINVVVGEDVVITDDVKNFSQNTKIILCDGTKLTTRKISGNSNTLTIYGQSEQTGQLKVQPVQESITGCISMFSELNVHGGIITAVTSDTSHDNNGIYMYGGSQTINVYGGKLITRGNGNYGAHGIKEAKEINIFGGALEAYGLDRGCGIRMTPSSNKITVRNHGSLIAQASNCASDADAGSGIEGSIEACDYAQVKAIGGDALDTADKSGGNGINGAVTIRDNAQVTAIAGNSSQSQSGKPGIVNNVIYYGGTLMAVGGAKGVSGSSNGYGIQGTLTNSSGGTIYYATNTDGSEELFSNPQDILSTATPLAILFRSVKVYQ